MKLLVITKDNLQVHGTGDDMWARHNRPSVVVAGKFMQDKVADGTLTILHQLSDEASDADFLSLYTAKGADQEKVVEEYAAAYAVDKPAAPKDKK